MVYSNVYIQQLRWLHDFLKSKMNVFWKFSKGHPLGIAHFLYILEHTVNCSSILHIYLYYNKFLISFSFAVSEMSEKVYRGSRNGTFMTVSKITLMTSANDDGVTIKCQAQHSALVKGLIYSHLEDFTNLTIYCK